MNKILLFAMCVALLGLSAQAFGQTIQVPPEQPRTILTDQMQSVERNRQKQDRMSGKDERGMIANRGGLRPLPPTTRPDGKAYSKKELKEIEAKKKPGQEDLNKFADFLKQPHTGILRLFPFIHCRQGSFIIRVDGDCADFIPDSWAYSFRTKGYSYNSFSDIRLEDGSLAGGSLFALGMMTALGDVSLAELTLESEGLKQLVGLEPKTEHQESVKQMASFAQGVEISGFKYSSSVAIKENTTYALRSVAYRISDRTQIVSLRKGMAPYEAPVIPINLYDERDDIIIAFRVIRQSDDGSVTILWKEFSRRNAPKLMFPKEMKVVYLKDDLL